MYGFSMIIFYYKEIIKSCLSDPVVLRTHLFETECPEQAECTERGINEYYVFIKVVEKRFIAS